MENNKELETNKGKGKGQKLNNGIGERHEQKDTIGALRKWSSVVKTRNASSVFQIWNAASIYHLGNDSKLTWEV